MSNLSQEEIDALMRGEPYDNSDMSADGTSENPVTAARKRIRRR